MPAKIIDFEADYSTIVNVKDPEEIQLWCKVFHCTEKDLRKATETVGIDATSVKKFFQKSSPNSNFKFYF